MIIFCAAIVLVLYLICIPTEDCGNEGDAEAWEQGNFSKSPGVGLGGSHKVGKDKRAMRAAEKTVGPVMSSIILWWGDYIANGLPYTLTLKTGKQNNRLVIKFQQIIEEIPGVVSLTERSSGGGITKMKIKFKGSSSETLKELSSSYNLMDKLFLFH